MAELVGEDRLDLRLRQQCYRRQRNVQDVPGHGLSDCLEGPAARPEAHRRTKEDRVRRADPQSIREVIDHGEEAGCLVTIHWDRDLVAGRRPQLGYARGEQVDGAG